MGPCRPCFSGCLVLLCPMSRSLGSSHLHLMAGIFGHGIIGPYTCRVGPLASYIIYYILYIIYYILYLISYILYLISYGPFLSLWSLGFSVCLVLPCLLARSLGLLLQCLMARSLGLLLLHLMAGIFGHGIIVPYTCRALWALWPYGPCLSLWLLGFSDCLVLLCLMARSFGLLLLPLMARTLGHHGMVRPIGPFSLACFFVNL